VAQRFGALEGLVTPVTQQVLFGGAFQDRRVLVTGHTGFKGSWLVSWLLEMGAHITGLALAPDTQPSLFEELGLASRIAHHVGDIRDAALVARVMEESRAEVVFHLAAQPLVRRSYGEPLATFETNVMGTANVLEAARAAASVRAVVVVTSDKCYENREWEFAYRENDAMGGHDPYSASKGAAELVVASYRRSFFAAADSAHVASARAGNVIGGGDWAVDRIIPDCMRALAAGRAVEVRNPGAVRPWQHVLEPLSGYLWLAACQLTGDRDCDSAWNFGPEHGGNLTVERVVERVVGAWGSGSWESDGSGESAVHEARTLKLDCTKAADELGWRPVWGADEAVVRATSWYKRFYAGEPAGALVTDDIRRYVQDAAGAPWSS